MYYIEKGLHNKVLAIAAAMSSFGISNYTTAVALGMVVTSAFVPQSITGRPIRAIIIRNQSWNLLS